MSGRSERVVLNPEEVAPEDRVETDLHKENILVGESGIDWGQAAIDAFMAQLSIGAIPIDSQIPNRIVEIPLLLGARGDYDAARIAMQAEVGRINEDGGTLKREIIGGSYGEAGKHVFADIVKASLVLSGDTSSVIDALDSNAKLELETLPDFYGDLIALSAFEGTGGASSTYQIKGNMPGRLDLSVTDLSGNAQLGLAWFFRCRNYSSAGTAAWALEAEALTRKLGAEEKALSGASGGSAVLHPNLSTIWTPILSTNIGSEYLTHAGIYDVWARVYTKTTPTPWLRLVYDVGDLIAPTELLPVRIPTAETFYLVNLGQINLRRSPLGTHRWEGILQGYGEEVGAGVYIDKLFFFCGDEGSGILSGTEQLVVGAEPVARDSFLQSSGKLATKKADTGQEWSGAGDADDFEVVE